MPKANRPEGDEKLAALFEQFGDRLVSPGGAAALLGLARQTIYTLCARGDLRAFRSDEGGATSKWVFIPTDDVYAYGEKVGRAVRGSRS